MSKKANSATMAARQSINHTGKEDARRLRRRRALIQAAVIGGVLIVAAVIVIVSIVASRPAPVTTPVGTARVTVSNVSDVPFEIGDDRVRLGFADAPVTVAVYEDFSCSHCQDFEAEAGGAMEDLIASGDIVLEVHPMKIVTDFGIRAGGAAACVAVDAPEQWLEARSALFAVHDASTDGWRAQDFAAFLSEQGLADESVVTCIDAGRYDSWISANTTAAAEQGVRSTPTVMIDGEVVDVRTAAQLRAAVEAAR